MKAFAALYRALDASTAQLAKQAALRHYLLHAQGEDAAWVVYFLAGGRPRQLVPSRLLKQVAREAAGLPEWLFDECYDTVGDLGETLSLLLPPAQVPQALPLSVWMAEHLLPLRQCPPAELPAVLQAQWALLAADERLVYFKLMTGSFRVGVSRLQVTQALAAVAGLDPKLVAQRLVGYTAITGRPTADDYARLVAPAPPEGTAQQGGHPYPFFLAHPLAVPLEEMDDRLGAVADWQVEWKWDGIRAQLVCRDGSAWLWSRGEELVSERFPEIMAMAESLPEGTVLDGEIVVWHADPVPLAPPADAAATDDEALVGVTEAVTEPEAEAARGAVPPPTGAAVHVQPFGALQRRIGRKNLSPKLLRELPVVLLAYDLLEWKGADLRAQPQAERRRLLDGLLQQVNHPALVASPVLQADDWPALADQRSQARALGVEGMMLKARDAQYGVGRTRDVGIWWKWKVEPLSVDAVLIYAQRGHGRRASLYSDYTFAVWDRPPGTPGRALVPFAKAYSGLTDAEMAKVDALIRKTTIESFGPVRSVRPTLVFELGFEGIGRSTRHKSGIAVRFPRMLRWRQDKPVDEADSLDTLAALLPVAERP